MAGYGEVLHLKGFARRSQINKQSIIIHSHSDVRTLCLAIIIQQKGIKVIHIRDHNKVNLEIWYVLGEMFYP